MAMRSFCLVILLTLAASSLAQQPAFSTTVNLVPVLASVHDRNGRIVADLNQNDFVLREDGKPQTIRYFSRETDLPLTVGLLIDTSRSQTSVLHEESQASSRFLNQVLRDKDQAFIVQFDTGVQTLQALTSSRDDLAAALQRLMIPNQIATLLYSAVQQSSDGILRGQPGRKALILLTDGVAYKDPRSISDAIEAAQRADTLLYSIRFSDPVHATRPLRAAFMEAMKARGKGDLERMARETGGVAYQVDANHPIDAIYSAIEADLRNQYNIGYTPPLPAPDGRYHRIQLTTHNHDLRVDARAGYYAR